MIEALRILLSALVVASLAAIVVYVAIFVAAAAWVLRNGRRPDPLSEELDRLLAEELDRALPGLLGESGTAGVGDR